MVDTKVKIRLLAPHFVRAGSQVGDEFDVDPALAQKLINQGRAEAADTPPAASKPETPNKRWNKTQLTEYAEVHGIEIPSGTNAEVLAAIEAHIKTETAAAESNDAPPEA